MRLGSITKSARTVTVAEAPGWIMPYSSLTARVESAIKGYGRVTPRILLRFWCQARWEWMESTEMPMSLTPRCSNSLKRRPNSVSSVEQTGVKSAGWEKRTTQAPACHSEKLSSPWVDMALKSGAGSPILGSERVSVMVGLLQVRGPSVRAGILRKEPGLGTGKSRYLKKEGRPET